MFITLCGKKVKSIGVIYYMYQTVLRMGPTVLSNMIALNVVIFRLHYIYWEKVYFFPGMHGLLNMKIYICILYFHNYDRS